MKFPHCFVTGTDTDAGKTVASASLLRYLAQSGDSVAGMKPLASGFDRVGGELINADIQMLQSASSYKLPDELVNQYGFVPAIAPHIAADFEGVEIDFDCVANAVGIAKARVDTLVVEGVGGWNVPLGICGESGESACASHAQKDISALANNLKLPIILVVGLRLGCLNHALLTARAILADGQPLLGWVACAVTPDFECSNENMRTLKQLMPARLLFEVPFLADELARRAYVPLSVNI
ncbi:dethiobiotin synthase [Arenicella sp. 4NH20-0111]|uniref:dethiobiotin synthase n=1 Tax=Arenicella sp. 4NH20-0111 TaxID=3127648 RepID=UPI00310B186A